ncbi:matrixin family metalloprotease [Saccharibacillus sacchari]|uniref:matrixin family metalloprotease n=1 Tax=Saccharibacillus sacchari TaxID=456493 RepID=UPI000685B761|nr:matrixin family metalloprotease [Saccharibacillus sacchari]
MKKGFLACAFISTIAATSIFGTTSAEAYNLLGGSYGDNKMTYTFLSSVPSNYQTSFINAAADWNATNTKIVFTPNTPDQKRDFTIRADNYGNTGWNAKCTNYRDFITFGNINSSVIEANFYYMDSMSSTYKKGVFSHEMGHGMGLAHVTDTKQIMCTSADGRAVFKPGSDDIAGINHLYK